MIDDLRESVRVILREQKDSMREIVTGLSDDGVNWLPGGNDDTNSIAQMLSHALEAERFLAATAVDAAIDRSREAQFQVAQVNSSDLVANIERTQQIVEGYLAQLTEAHIGQTFTRGTGQGERSRTGGWWLLHAVEHSREHIGQAYLTRQLFERQAK